MGNLSTDVEVINIESDDDDLEVTAYVGTSSSFSMYLLIPGYARHAAH